MAKRPRFSILTPVFDPPLSALRSCIRSVRRQTTGDWELCLADDASRSGAVVRTLRRAAHDPRVKVATSSTNAGIVAASNLALGSARGEFVALLDHDDILARHALAAVDKILLARPEVDFVYSDEDYLSRSGRRFNTYRKPEWSPERLRSTMYTSHLSVYRRDLVLALGGFRSGFDGSQDHDLALRVSEQARAVAHVPDVLYHWRQVRGSVAHSPSAKPYAYEAGRRAVQDHCDRVGIGATVEMGDPVGTYMLRRNLPPEVRVVMAYLSGCEPSVDDRIGPPSVFHATTVAALAANAHNVAADVIVLRLRPARPTTPGWWEVLAALAVEGVIAAPQVLRDDGMLLDGGWAERGGALVPLHVGCRPGAPTPGEELRITREVDAVSPVVVALRASDLPRLVTELERDPRGVVRGGDRRVVWTPAATVMCS